MNRAIREAASTLFKDDCKGGSDKNNSLLCIIIAVIFFCCGGSGFLGGGNSCGCESKSCGGRTGLGGSWIIILIILLCCCGNDGFGNVLGAGGNVNTNVINVDTDDSYDDDYDM